MSINNREKENKLNKEGGKISINETRKSDREKEEYEKRIERLKSKHVSEERKKRFNSFEEEMREFKNEITPEKIKLELDEYIKGQEDLKKKISLLAYNHKKKCILSKYNFNIKKENMLLLGPTGSGKTFTLEVLSKIIKIPLIILDATMYSASGWKGPNYSEEIDKILNKVGEDGAIIYIDEMDKMMSKSYDERYSISYVAIQENLLKTIEKEDGKNANITFVFGGAFTKLEKELKSRKGKSSIGFLNNELTESIEDDNHIFSNVTNDDLIKFGIIPEFLGRISMIASTSKLTSDEMKKILFESKNSVLIEYQKRLDVEGIKLIVEDEVIDMIVKEAMNLDTGARALNKIVKELFLDIEYNAYSSKNISKIVITKEYFEKIFYKNKELAK